MRMLELMTPRDRRAMLSFCGAVLLATTGHAARREALVLEDGEQLQSLYVVSVLRNTDLAVRTQGGGPLTGFLGGGLPPGAVDFQGMFLSGLDSLVAAASWPPRRVFEVQAAVPTIDLRKTMFAQSNTGAMLVLDTAWFLSFDMRTMVIDTRATLYDSSGTAPAEVQRYQAEFVAASASVPGHDQQSILQVWTEDHGVRLYRATREGVHDILAMLAEDVFARQFAPVESQNAGEEFAACDPRDGQGSGWRGTTLSQSGSRLTLRREDGNLFSVPVEYRKPVPVFAQEDFRFKISYRPDDRPYVQVTHPSGNAWVALDPAIELADNDGLSAPRVALVLRAVKKHEGELRSVWDQVHGARLRARAASAGR